jgi:hypothetical protein
MVDRIEKQIKILLFFCFIGFLTIIILSSIYHVKNGNNQNDMDQIIERIKKEFIDAKLSNSSINFKL